MMFDALYGSVSLPRPCDALVYTPEVQRLRHVFLSNIPSVDIPGIAYVSRFEHSMGVAALAAIVSRARSLDEEDAVALQAAALLHDVAMPGLGHLMEEAFAIAGCRFDHESHLHALFSGDVDAGGTAFQIFAGKEVGFRRVLYESGYSPHLATRILETIRGVGPLGGLLNGSVDLDNIDNVCRMAYHMGLRFRLDLPLQLATMLCIDDGALVVGTPDLDLIREWQSLRTRVYQHLMFAPRDFAAKTMLVRSLANMIRRGKEDAGSEEGIIDDEWRLTYEEATTRLCHGRSPEASVLKRLYAGDLYKTVLLLWIDGPYPGLVAALELEDMCNKVLRSTCVLYAIPDKRFRRVTARVVDNGRTMSIGESAQGWLLGVCSTKQPPKSAGALDRVVEYVEQRLAAGVRRVDLGEWANGAAASSARAETAGLFD